MRSTTLVLMVLLTACASPNVPIGMEQARVFTQQVTTPYQEAYRSIAKQMRACYRGLGLFGNGYDVQADLDSVARKGTVEIYYVGLTGAQKPEDSIFSRTVVVEDKDGKTVITTSGTTPKYVYATHATIPSWLKGVDVCSPQ